MDNPKWIVELQDGTVQEFDGQDISPSVGPDELFMYRVRQLAARFKLDDIISVSLHNPAVPQTDWKVTVDIVPWAEGDEPNFPSTYCYECDESNWCDHIEAVYNLGEWCDGTFMVLHNVPLAKEDEQG